MKYFFSDYFFICFFSFIFLLSPLITHAVSATISPARQGIVVARGTTQRAFVTVTNNGVTPEIFAPKVDAFTIHPDTGRAVFGANEEAISWVRAFPASLEIKPKRKGTFFFDISVPENAEVRSRYLGLFVTQQPMEGQIGIGSEVGSLLFLHIQGVQTEQLVEVVFSADKKIVFTPRASLTLVLKNIGTIHSVPRGSVVVTQNDRVVKEFSLNPHERKMLPDGLWHATYLLDGLTFGNVGKLNASAIVQYGLENQTQFIAKTTLWFLQWQIVVATGIIVCIILLILARVRTVRRKVLH